MIDRRITRQAGILFLLWGFLLGTLPLWSQDSFANGLRPVIGKAFRLSLFGTRTADHNEMRSFAKLADSLAKVEKRFLGWDIPLDRPVRIMLFTDTEFPCRDVWTAAGRTPGAKDLDAYVEDNSLMFATMSGYEMAHYQDTLNEKWFFLNAQKLKKEYAAHPKKLDSETTTYMVNLVKEQRDRLEAGFGKPMREQLRDYRMFEDAAYSFPFGVIWAPILKADALHRDLATIVHEFGHHLFYQLVTSVVNNHKSQKNWTRLQLFATNRSLLALNEFFADYAAISNDYPLLISVHNCRKGITEEFKRYFSRERTLAEYLAEVKSASEKNKHTLTEGHNSLNPCRSLVWKLKLALGDDTTDKLVVKAVRTAIHHFYAKVVPGHKRTEAPNGWGCFSLVGYPIDVRTENLRLLEFLQEASKSVLSAPQQQIFAREAAKVFPGEYPLKGSFR